jgi:phosphoribosylanthranilate isomerase
VRTRVKICGITRPEDAALAIELGADAVGFVLWPASPRAVTAGQAAAIDTAGAFTARIGVFVNASSHEVAQAVRAARLGAVQLHGDEHATDFSRVGAPVIKAVTLADSSDVEKAIALPADVTVLVDASDSTKRGGTGRLADWSRAREVSSARPVILAGGLSAANIGDAIRAVRPWGVDVSSGVESTPGVKSAERMRELFAALATVDREGK